MRKSNYLFIKKSFYSPKNDWLKLTGYILKQENAINSPFFSDGVIHPQYQHYAPEYYPGPPYPNYTPEHHFDHEQGDYFTSQIHVKPFLSFFLNYLFLFNQGTTKIIIYFTWWYWWYSLVFID
jgi:hypothetical protein